MFVCFIEPDDEKRERLLGGNNFSDPQSVECVSVTPVTETDPDHYCEEITSFLVFAINGEVFSIRPAHFLGVFEVRD